MKTIRIIFSLLLITAMSMPTLSAQTKKEKKELKILRLPFAQENLHIHEYCR